MIAPAAMLAVGTALAVRRGKGSCAVRDAAVIDASNALVAERGRWGFWKLFDWLRAQGHTWNHKRVHGVYCALRLNLARRTVRRVPKRTRQPLEAPRLLNQTWAMDFMSDMLYDGRRVRPLTIIDEGNREALDIVVAASLPSLRVTRVLDALALVHGAPQAIRVDNGPEFLAQSVVEWCAAHGTAIHHIQPGKPDHTELQTLTDTWLRVYNEERPHDSLGRVPPLTFLPRPQPAVPSPLEGSA